MDQKIIPILRWHFLPNWPYGLIYISVRCVKHKFNHFARQLQKTMKGLGTDDDTLVRVIVSRCEIDLVNIKEEFEKLTGQTLQQYIAVSLLQY